MTTSDEHTAATQTDSDLPPGEPVVGNDANAEPGEQEPLDGMPVPTLTEPGDTNGG